MKRVTTAFVFAAAFAAVPLWAAPRAPEFRDTVAAEELGLELPVLQGARQVPAKPVEVLRYKWTDGSREWFEERSPMDELWRTAQTAGTWEDKAGNSMTLARVLCKLPPGFAGTDVTKETFEKVLRDPDQSLAAEASPSELAAWLRAFAGAEPDASRRPERIQTNPSRIADGWILPCADPRTRALALRFRPARSAEPPCAWYAVVFRLAAAPQGDSFDRALRMSFLGNVRLGAAPAGPGRFAKQRERLTKSSGEIREDAARRAARQSVALLDDWWHMDSENYILLSDDPAAARRGDTLLLMLESLRPRYEALVPAFKRTIAQTSVVRVFRKREDYVRYVAESGVLLDPNQSAGIFDGSRRELVISPEVRGWTTDPNATVRHEGFHQYLFAAWNGAHASLWFNEGMAEVFETYEPKGKTAWRATESESHVRRLESLARSQTDAQWRDAVRRLLFADARAFYRPADGDVNRNYALAWGVAHFLCFGAPAVRGEPYKAVLPTYFDEMEKHGDCNRATAAAFAMGEDGSDAKLLDRFARDLQTFWKNESARRAARAAKTP
ncbi:MAG: DUF1570 domain-containing protein [Kiritimatiellae bacterium]|nr:DUF1570 domain-containing protein [Kiritimatiellia bacterium]